MPISMAGKENRISDWSLGRTRFLKVFLVALAIILRFGSESTATFGYYVLGLLALFGRIGAVQALSLSWLFTMINPELAPPVLGAAIGRFSVIFAATFSIFLRNAMERPRRIDPTNALTFLLGVVLIIHSLLFSVIVDVSLLKVVSWVITVLTLLSAWQGMSSGDRSGCLMQLQAGLVVLTILSVPLIAVPSVGFFVNGTGFQGVLNHPQAFGPMVALLGGSIGGRLLGTRAPSWMVIGMLGVCVILVTLSEARTAGFAMVLGLIFTVIFAPLLAGSSRKVLMPGLYSRRFQGIAVLSVVGIFLVAPMGAGKFEEYLFKRSDSTSLIEAASASRGGLVDAMLENIQQRLTTGIGFGIGSDPEFMEIERDPVLNLPISAPIEKGVLPIAVLEELGAFGAGAVLIWLLFILRRSARAGVGQFAIVVTLLLLNFGEYMLFSVSGMGLLLLIFMTGAVSSYPQAVQGSRRA